MKNVLYLKVFNNLPKIEYQKKAVHISFGHTFLGIALLLLVIYFIFQNLTEQHYSSIIVCAVFSFFGFIISLVRTSKVYKDISDGMLQNKITAETKYSYDGGNSWFPLGPTVGILLGLIIARFSENFNNYDFPISIVSFGAGFVLAIGLSYLYWEFKYNRKILVYRYDRKKNS